MDNGGEVEMHRYRKEIMIILLLIFLCGFLSAGNRKLKLIEERKFKEDELERTLTIDSEGMIYLVTKNHTVRKYSPNGKLLSEFGGRGVKDGEFLKWPDILVDKSGYIYASDNWLKRIQKFDKNGTLVKKWELIEIEDGEYLKLIGIDSKGSIYVDYSDGIWKFDSNGSFYPLIMNERAYTKIEIDLLGNTYLLDLIEKNIIIFDANGNKVDRIELQLKEIEKTYGSLEKFATFSMKLDENSNIYILVRDIGVILKISAYTKKTEIIEFEKKPDRKDFELIAVREGKYFYYVFYGEEELLQIYQLSD